MTGLSGINACLLCVTLRVTFSLKLASVVMKSIQKQYNE
jgi:hypothetical protein